ncbi:MAG TPA: NAD-dependent epimerase/dehydratase family protein [Spirochaetota bacterium]|nr:NAD-dependent epimerase/dehydratase family protein [Spirochaetota bacterium]
MKIFVTGGTGFIGRNLIPRLVQKRHKVTAVARSAYGKSQLDLMGATPVDGNLASVSTFTSNFSKADAVIHLGAKTESWGLYNEFFEINVRASEEITGAASYHGVKKLIYLSCASVVCTGNPLFDVDEDYKPSGFPSDNYSKSKAIAEEKVRNASSRLNTVILRPAFVWGKQVPFIERLRHHINRIGFPNIGKQGHQFSTCHVENIVEAIITALDQPDKSGTFYVTDGEPVAVKFFMPQLLLSHGLFAGRVNLPRSFALVLAGFFEIIWAIIPFKKTPPLTKNIVNILGSEATFSDNKFREVFSFKNRVQPEEELRSRRY